MVRNIGLMLGLAGSATEKQKAAIIRLTVSEPIRELLKGIPQQDRDDPEEILAYLRSTAKPNRDAHRFRIMASIMATTQRAPLARPICSKFRTVVHPSDRQWLGCGRKAQGLSLTPRTRC